jgi:hypothetical protein
MALTSFAQKDAPHAELANDSIRLIAYLPDSRNGFYRGTRFDWAGVIGSLTHEGHEYYGRWFTQTDPDVHDFAFRGSEIVAGPCSAITGPVEEFSTDGKALGFDEAKPGGTFIKIGVGVLRRPDAKDYDPYRLYEIVDAGHRTVQRSHEFIEFSQKLADPHTGYGYLYSKTVRLVKSKPQVLIEHRLANTGKRKIDTSVYDHNFLVLDNQPVGPDFTITLPFQMNTSPAPDPKMAEVRGNEFLYRKTLVGEDTVATRISGYNSTPSDYEIRIQNKKIGAGMTISGNRPLSDEHLWSIRTVLAMEPFIFLSIAPGQEVTWSYTYTYGR